MPKAGMWTHYTMADKPPPCDTCRFADRCRTEELACTAYLEYCRSGKSDSTDVRIPSSTIYIQALKL